MTTGSVLAQFTITLSQAVSEQVAVEWHTEDGTAQAGVDYAPAKGTALFAPGETSKVVDILVYGRAVGSEDRSFFVEMLPPTNAILGASIGECIIHVDTTGSTPVTQIIVPTGPRGLQGDSAYQTWLDLGNTGTEQDFLDSLKPSPEEIAEEVAPLLDMGESPVTADGTAALSKPDTMKLKELARRVAYVGATKIATMALAAGDNLVGQSDMTGDIIEMSSHGLHPRIVRGTAIVTPKWSVESDGRLVIKDATAGDVLFLCQYDIASSDKINASERELWRWNLAEVGINLVDGSFEDGAIASGRADAVWHKAGSRCYMWGGDLPKIVSEKTNPATTGGISSTAWIDTTTVTLTVADYDGLRGYRGWAKSVYVTGVIGTAKPEGIAGYFAYDATDTTSADNGGAIIVDALGRRWKRVGVGSVNVAWFGAKGNWNPGTAQTGDDDTLAVQKALDYIASVGSRRAGAVRSLYFPTGNYRLRKLKYAVGIGFALITKGDGQFASQLFFDHTDPNPAFDCEIESLEFRGLGIFGSLSDTAAGTPAAWKDIGFKGRNFYNIPDVDVKFSECGILFWKEFSQIYGRGVAFDNCGIGEINNLLNIVCDPTITFVAGDALRSVETGMRNYVIRNCRTDQVRETLVKVTGEGPQKEYINGLAIRNNDLVATVKLIDAPDATLRRLSIGDNTGLYSFRFGVVAAKGIYSINMHDCNLSRRFEETVEPSGFNDCIPFLINTSEQLHDVDVDRVVARNLSGNPVATAGSASKVSIKNITAPNAWTHQESGSNIAYIFYAPGNCPGLQIDGNQFSSTVTSRTYRAFNPAAQTDKNTFVGVNPAPWNWGDCRLGYTPSLLVNGVATSVTPSSRSGRYHYDGKYVHVEVMLIVALTETSGALAISLPPITAIAENPEITGFYAGGGEVNNYAGFSVAGSVFSRITVNPATQRAELWRENGMGRTAVGAGDKSGTVTLYVSFKYRA